MHPFKSYCPSGIQYLIGQFFVNYYQYKFDLYFTMTYWYHSAIFECNQSFPSTHKETIFYRTTKTKSKKDHNSAKRLRVIVNIKLDLYFIMIYICHAPIFKLWMKLMHPSKVNEWKWKVRKWKVGLWHCMIHLHVGDTINVFSKKRRPHTPSLNHCMMVIRSLSEKGQWFIFTNASKQSPKFQFYFKSNLEIWLKVTKSNKSTVHYVPLLHKATLSFLRYQKYFLRAESLLGPWNSFLELTGIMHFTKCECVVYHVMSLWNTSKRLSIL